ncbi:hypothetical protein ABZ897_15400 [Nonomuraea sp. NPDC046802]|uniref:hypothetical protein n=1 Tax=Nonomuraea sp. NPDC046802 TaxID=3154919 RepID=UPI0033E66437
MIKAEALAQELSERRRGGVLIDLAALGIQRGDRNQVVSYGDRAVELARQTGSKVIARRQYEVTSGGRIWYAIDDAETTIWLTKVAAGHPKASERRNH